MNTFQIIEEFQSLNELANEVYFNEETGEIIDNSKVLEAMLEEITGEAGYKLDALEAVKKNNRASSDAIEKEIKRLQNRKKGLDKNFESVKDLQSMLLRMTGEKNIKTTLNSFSFRESKVVELDPLVAAYMLPEKFQTIKTTITPNKVELKKAIEAGEHIDGVVIETRKNLQVK